MLQRDAFILAVRQRMQSDPNIFFLSADFGAEQLDHLRKDFPERFIHCGISEQNMIDVATGLALDGRKVFCYAMAPFISMRALEQIKCGPAIMNLPVVLLSIGIGLGYADSGPTHYVSEDYACLRSIAGCSIYTISDTNAATKVADHLLDNPKFAYVRMDRSFVEPIQEKYHGEFWRLLYGSDKAKVAVVSHGRPLSLAYDCIIQQTNADVALYDVICSEPFPVGLVSLLRQHRGILVIDEQVSRGGLMAAIHETLSESEVYMPMRQISLPSEFIFDNGGRDKLLNERGFNAKTIVAEISRLEAI